MRLSNRLAKIIFACAALLLLLLTYILYKQFSELTLASKQVSRTNLVKYKLEKALSILKDVETAQRGYLLTKDSLFLTPFLGARENTAQLINDLDQLFDNNSEQQKNLSILNSYIDIRFKSFQHQIDHFENFKSNSTVSKYSLLKSKESMDRIREHIALMMMVEERLLKYREQMQKRYQLLTPFYAMVLLFFVLVILVFSYGKLIEELNKSKAFQKKLGQVNNELKKKNNALELYNKELDSFAYIASHDLREPLRKIQLFCNVIQSDEQQQLSERNRFNMHRIQQSAKRMQKLLNDLLHYSHYTQSNENIFKMVSLATILEEAEESLFEAIEDSNATISKKHLPSINGMHFQLRQLFENLISNSIKFRKPDVDPVISIEAKLITGKDIYPSLPTNNARYFNITYRDNGIGFNSNYSNKIFDLFQRLEVKEKQHGTGMGLTICRKIVQNHDGFIKAFSEENHGSRFEIYLPA